jgi:glycosyltransferase involved in cell wall biosynthesis
MRSVLVTKFTPFPTDSGGKMRSMAVLRQLLELGDVTLCCFTEPEADISELQAMGVDVRTVPYVSTPVQKVKGALSTRSLLTGRFWDARLAETVDIALAEKGADVLCVEYSAMVPYLKPGKHTTVLDLHNIESVLTKRMAKTKPFPLSLVLEVESALFGKVEAKGIAGADIVMVVSDQDEKRLPRPPKELLVCPNGINPSDPPERTGKPVVAFVALMSWTPNVDAANFLIDKVWPLVRKSITDAELLIVGRNPPEEIMAKNGTDGVVVTGTVPDVRPYLAQCSITVAPLRAGGGSRLKILESLDAGRPVVATSIGVEGLEDLVGNGVVVADEPEAMASRIVELLEAADVAAELGRKGHDTVEQRYAWPVVLAPLRKSLEQRQKAR